MKAICLAYKPNAWILPYFRKAWARHAADVPLEVWTCGKGVPFGGFWLAANSRQTQPYVLFLDDYILRECDTVRLRAAFDLFKTGGGRVGYVRLYPCPGPTLAGPRDGFGGIDPQSPYSLSLQATIWNPVFVPGVVNHDWSPWDCEIRGSEALKSRSKWTLLCATGSIVSYANLLRRGQVQPEEMRYAESL